MKKIKGLVIYAADKETTFSYQKEWVNQLSNNKLFDCTLLNIWPRDSYHKLKNILTLKFRSFDAILIMHSVFSNTNRLNKHPLLFDLLVASTTPKIFFMANEYKSMPQKMEFSKNLNISMLVTQSSSKKVHSLYKNELRCEIIGLPNALVNTALFEPHFKQNERGIDIGYRSTSGPLYFGHQERSTIAEYFIDNSIKYDLKLDVSTNDSNRFSSKQWAEFLNNCKAILGTESGYDYFETTDKTRLAVNKFVAENPNANFDTVHETFFEKYGAKIPMRVLSGRNVEAAATKTLQILFEGEYQGYLKPDIHYIPLKKDFSNFDETIKKFQDIRLVTQITNNAYDLVQSELHPNRIIENLHKHLLPLL